MSGMAPSRTRRINRLHTRPGEPCQLPPAEKRYCQLCGCRLASDQWSLICSPCSEGLGSKPEGSKRKVEVEKYGQIIGLREAGWTWPEIGFLVGANPTYLNSVICKYKRGEM